MAEPRRPARGHEAPGGPVRLELNGRAVEVAGPGDRRLVDVLRGELGLTGTKEACGVGVCGVCSVLVDGRLVSGCLTQVGSLDGARVVTIEGLGTPSIPSVVQAAFAEAGGYQCGICTPGQIVAATALLAETPDPTPDEIRHWMAGSLCRCTGYASIIAAIRLAAERLGAGVAASVTEPGEPA